MRSTGRAGRHAPRSASCHWISRAEVHDVGRVSEVDAVQEVDRGTQTMVSELEVLGGVPSHRFLSILPSRVLAPGDSFGIGNSPSPLITPCFRWPRETGPRF